MKQIYQSELKELEGKYFSSEEECLKAENEVKAKSKQKELAKSKRVEDAKEIERLANEYISKVQENKKIKKTLDEEASTIFSEYKQKLNEFAKNNNGYHLTYTSDGDNLVFKVEEAKQSSVEDSMKSLRKSLSSLSDFFLWF